MAALPVYQIAFWPDGWDLLADGAVSVRDTHDMAEARRWYDLAWRNRTRRDLGPALAMHGLYIPQAILDLSRRTFASEQAASVAVRLVAGAWVGHRRAQLLRSAAAALAEHRGAWTGSRHGPEMDAEGVRTLVSDLLGLCVSEGLIPRADYALKVRRGDGFGVCRYRVQVETLLEPYARARVGDVLAVALIPWNRAVGKDAGASPVISVGACARAPGHHRP